MYQPGKVANPARGQLNRENNIPLSPCVPENLVSRDGFSRPVPRQPAHLHIFRLNLVPYFGWIGFYVWEDVPAGGCQQVYVCFDIGATVFLVEVLSGVF